MNAEQAIREPQQTNSIVHIEDADDATIVDLLSWCDDWAENGPVAEYWGRDWRVHATQGAQQ